MITSIAVIPKAKGIEATWGGKSSSFNEQTREEPLKSLSSSSFTERMPRPHCQQSVNFGPSAWTIDQIRRLHNNRSIWRQTAVIQELPWGRNLKVYHGKYKPEDVYCWNSRCSVDEPVHEWRMIDRFYYYYSYYFSYSKTLFNSVLPPFQKEDLASSNKAFDGNSCIPCIIKFKYEDEA